MDNYKMLSQYDIRTVLSMTDLFPTLVDNGDGTYTNMTVPLSAIREYSAVPGGGTTGQYLKKLNNTDYATTWASPSKSDVGLSNVDNTSDLAKPVSTATTAAIQALYPVGSVYINASVSTNPATLLGFGTWVAFGTGQVMVGVDTGQTEFNTLGKTGGEKAHTLTVAEMPSHTHTQFNWLFNGAGAAGNHYGMNYNANGARNQMNTTGSSEGGEVGDNYNAPTGGGGSHNNLQPYITVYMWKRTA